MSGELDLKYSAALSASVFEVNASIASVIGAPAAAGAAASAVEFISISNTCNSRLRLKKMESSPRGSLLRACLEKLRC